MATMLSMNDIEELVARQAKQFDATLTREHVHVYEDLGTYGDETLVVEIATRRPEDRTGWIELQMRVSHGIRDQLVRRGDERYPLIEIFEPEEWAIRHDRAEGHAGDGAPDPRWVWQG